MSTLPAVEHAAPRRRALGPLRIAIAFAIVAAGAFAVGSLFEALDDNAGFARADRAVAQWGADHQDSTVTRVARVVTHLGGAATLLPLMAVVGIGLVLARRRRWTVVAYLAVVGVGITLLNNLLKWIVDRPRPNLARLVEPSGSSFPSGHAASSAACWAAVAVVGFLGSSTARRTAALVVAVLIALAVAATRLLLGVHWLTDVVAGLAEGWAWFAVCTVLLAPTWLRNDPPRPDHTPQPAGPASA